MRYTPTSVDDRSCDLCRPATHQLTDHLRSVLAEANGQPQGVAIAVGYFYLPGFTQVRDLLPTRPGKDRIRRVPQGRLDRPC